jgi:oxygen-independent coproporphyrinogen-3 oxidase
MLDLPDEESQVRMYDDACALASEHGYAQYEISNFAKPGRESRHNLCYWRGEEYLGYGPGAVGCFADGPVRRRYTVMKHPERYCDAVEQGTKLWCDEEDLGAEELGLERLMLGLRLNEGLPHGAAQIDPRGLKQVQTLGWIEDHEGLLKLTPAGRHFCSEVVARLAT